MKNKTSQVQQQSKKAPTRTFLDKAMFIVGVVAASLTCLATAGMAAVTFPIIIIPMVAVLVSAIGLTAIIFAIRNRDKIKDSFKSKSPSNEALNKTLEAEQNVPLSNKIKSTSSSTPSTNEQQTQAQTFAVNSISPQHSTNQYSIAKVKIN